MAVSSVPGFISIPLRLPAPEDGAYRLHRSGVESLGVRPHRARRRRNLHPLPVGAPSQLSDSTPSDSKPAHTCTPFSEEPPIATDFRDSRISSISRQAGHASRLTAVMASPRPTAHASRTPVTSPCRGSGPDGGDIRSHHREPAPTAPAGAVARRHVLPIRRQAWLPTSRTQARVLVCRPRCTVQQYLHQKTGCGNAICDLTSSEHVVHRVPDHPEATIAVAISGPLTPGVHVDGR